MKTSDRKGCFVTPPTSMTVALQETAQLAWQPKVYGDRHTYSNGKRGHTVRPLAAKFWTNQSQETKLFLGSTLPCRLRCPPLCRDRSCGEQCLGLVTVFPYPHLFGTSVLHRRYPEGCSRPSTPSVSQSLRSQSLPLPFRAKKHKHLPADKMLSRRSDLLLHYVCLVFKNTNKKLQRTRRT